MRLLLVEDDGKLSRLIARGLREEGFAVDTARDGEDAAWRAVEGEYDCVVLDVMLPKLDGFGVLAKLREAGKLTPVLMLTARGALEDRLRGLRGGADDYLTKPFAFEELLARLHVLVRRHSPERDVCLRAKNVVLNPLTRQALVAGAPVELNPKEFSILEYLLRHRGRVISRTCLAEHVWDENFDAMSNVVDVTVYRLREKLQGGLASPLRLIETVRGAGYVIKKEDSA
jgi:DNA-binding response OmpR family regulator